MDQAIHPAIEARKSDSFSAAYKSLMARIEKRISVNNIGKSSSLITAQLPQYEFVRHAFPRGESKSQWLRLLKDISKAGIVSVTSWYRSFSLVGTNERPHRKQPGIVFYPGPSFRA
jgi:hypothetical protein